MPDVVKNFIKEHWKYLLGLALVLALCFFVYKQFEKVQPITYESQKQAETPAGVELAAKNAYIDMLQSQLNEAAKQITDLKNKPPDQVIHTVPIEVPKIIEAEREKRGADFAIVTDPVHPDKQVNMDEIKKLPEQTAVTLNQYNVYAYPQRLAEVSYYSNNSGDAAYMSRVKVFGKTGYVGPVLKYDNSKVSVGARVSVPF